jgi:hypothetical protein
VQYIEERRRVRDASGHAVYDHPSERWMCRPCHEARQTESTHCALCDQVIVQRHCLFRHRDAEGVGPPVPVCDECAAHSSMLGSESPVWQVHVCEAKLFAADAAVAIPGAPTMFDLAWAVMSPDERAALVGVNLAEADAAFADDTDP